MDGARPGYVTNDKSIYSGTGSVHAQSLYLKDTLDGVGNSDEIRIMTEHQSYNNIHLYVPNLDNFDGYGGRRRSELMVTSVNQTIIGKNIFQDIEVANPVDREIAKISRVDSTQFIKKAGDTMTGDLILTPNNYPILGNTNKAIS